MTARQRYVVRGKKNLSTHRVQTLRIFCMAVFSCLIKKGFGTGTLSSTKEQECWSVEDLRLTQGKFHYFLQSSSLQQNWLSTLPLKAQRSFCVNENALFSACCWHFPSIYSVLSFLVLKKESGYDHWVDSYFLIDNFTQFLYNSTV